jgi:hypothetical protein
MVEGTTRGWKLHNAQGEQFDQAYMQSEWHRKRSRTARSIS